MFLVEPHGQAFVGTHVLLPTRMDALLIGVMVAVIMRTPNLATWLSQQTSALYASLIILLLSVSVLGRYCDRSSLPMGTAGLSILALLYGCFLLIAVLEKSGPISWLTNLAPLRKVGTWAYFIYLFHGTVPVLVFQILGIKFNLYSLLHWTLLMWSFVLVVLFAAASWRYFEKPLVNIGHRWRYKFDTDATHCAVARA
jgi:peptidoglycan/LPS O-acetylase OafA/YrhL